MYSFICAFVHLSIHATHSRAPDTWTTPSLFSWSFQLSLGEKDKSEVVTLKDVKLQTAVSAMKEGNKVSMRSCALDEPREVDSPCRTAEATLRIWGFILREMGIY